MFVDTFCGVSSGSNNTALQKISLGSFSPCFTDVVLIGVVHIVMIFCMIARCVQLRRSKFAKGKKGRPVKLRGVHATISKVMLIASTLLAIIPLLQLQSTLTIGTRDDPFSPSPGKALPYQIFASALSAGAWLGGQKCVMLMQSSGVGNCINMLSLIETCRFPFVAFVTMRGQWHEFNPWQMPMGTTTKQALETAGCLVDEVEDPADVGSKAAAALHKAFVGQQSTVLLLSQRLVPVKTFGK